MFWEKSFKGLWEKIVKSKDTQGGIANKQI